jgi:parallel beta-helix repeat protein
LEKNNAACKDASITLISSMLCNITGNNVHYSRQGIKLVNCSFNQLYLNDIRQNDEGIYLDEGVYPQQSSGNEIYLNSFINNLRDVNSYISTNSWNSPQTLSYRFQGKIFKNRLGNYWQGTRMSDDNNDGISDLYHNIGSDIDKNPLMEPAAIYEII